MLLPLDVLFEAVQYMTTKTVLRLASTCRHLRATVYGHVRTVVSSDYKKAPASVLCRMTGLEVMCVDDRSNGLRNTERRIFRAQRRLRELRVVSNAYWVLRRLHEATMQPGGAAQFASLTSLVIMPSRGQRAVLCLEMLAPIAGQLRRFHLGCDLSSYRDFGEDATRLMAGMTALEDLELCSAFPRRALGPVPSPEKVVASLAPHLTRVRLSDEAGNESGHDSCVRIRALVGSTTLRTLVVESRSPSPNHGYWDTLASDLPLLTSLTDLTVMDKSGERAQVGGHNGMEPYLMPRLHEALLRLPNLVHLTLYRPGRGVVTFSELTAIQSLRTLTLEEMSYPSGVDGLLALVQSGKSGVARITLKGSLRKKDRDYARTLDWRGCEMVW